MPYSATETAFIKEIQRDLRLSIRWLDDILETDNLHCDETLTNAALAESYVSSCNRRINELINNIRVPAHSEFNPATPEEETSSE